MRNKLNKNEIFKVLDLLAAAYPDAECMLNYNSPYQLLVAVVLSAQTTDKRVNEVTEGLFDRCPDAEHMAKCDKLQLENIIHSIGMYRQKAKNVINLSKMLMEKYDGQVPDNQELLEELPGVGRKSANVVMSVAFGHPRIPVDTHVFRLANRIGLVNEKNVLNTEKALMKAIPKGKWTETHHRLIWHGRRVCTAKKPKCHLCNLEEVCLKKV